METKKVNLFAFLMMIIMCVVSIYVGISKKSGGTDGLSAYQIACKYGFKGTEEQWLASLKEGNPGKSAYEIAVSNGYSGTEVEWLLSLNGTNGENALASVSAHDIYGAYLTETGQTESEYTYADFLTYYYSVVGKYDAQTATQLAYSTTVDICYSFSFQYTEVIAATYNSNQIYVLNQKSSGGVSAGAGVIYQMLDTDSNGELDTAYIITNYHVAYIENYCNDYDNYDYYGLTASSMFGGTTLTGYATGPKYDRSKVQTTTSNGQEVNYILRSDMPENFASLTIDETIQTHFFNGEDDKFYGIYLYGYQSEEYELKASFVGGSADNDIAVLKIDRNNLSASLADIFFDSGNFNQASLGDSSEIVGGEDVIAVGNPLIAETNGLSTLSEYKQAYVDALVLSSTNGVVSVVSNDCLFSSIIDSSKTVSMRLIRVSAAINSGNSGGGLYDLHGNLVGIVNSKISSSSYDNIGYAIPINIAKNVAEQIILQCDGITPTNTRIKTLKTKNIGFEVQNGESKARVVTNSTGQKEWFVSYNVMVKNIGEASVAYAAGLRNDDIILQVAFGGQIYSANEYFNKYYELNDLLLSVGQDAVSISFKIARSEGSNLVEYTYTVELAAANFVEIA